MELVGTAVAYREENGSLRVVFRCTNKEEFDLLQSPSIARIPSDVLVRVWTCQAQNGPGEPAGEPALVHWEELS